MLVGREQELRRLLDVVDEARRGRSGALVVVGEAGVGKSALLAEARLRAVNVRLLSATGVESESELPFSSLHELLRPLLDLLPQIPESQARALAAALALEDGEPDALAVGAGTLSLLVEAAEQSPVLVVLDDAHWLDRASVSALAFAVRRLTGEEVAVLAAVRPGLLPEFDVMPRLELGPLGEADARLLLGSRSEPVPPADESRLIAAAAGNPLVLLELPVDLAHELPASATPSDRLTRAFSLRFDDLSDAGRLGLLLAAAEPDSSVVSGAAATLGLVDPLGPARTAGLIHTEGERIVFRHPVVRSLVYATSPVADRSAAHRALAGALPGEGDRDRAAWHLAAAATSPDEEIADLLELTAERATARGGQVAAARALERAGQLSPSRSDGARRLYSASRAAFWAGDAGRALDLAEAGLSLVDDPLLRADLIIQIGSTGELHGTSGTEAEPMYLQALESAELDEERTAKLVYQVVKLRLDAFDAAGALELAPRLEAAARGAGPWWEPRALAGAAAAYLVAGQRDHATPLFRELVTNPAIPAVFPYDYMALEWYDELRTALAETLREGRATGHLLRIAWNQSVAAHLELRLGRLNASAAAASEAIPLGETIGTPVLVGIASAALATVHAWRGQAEPCREGARVAIAAAVSTGDRYQEALANQSIALLALGGGDPDEAVFALEPFARRWAESSVVEPSVVPFVPDLVEAYAQVGSTADARSWLDAFSAVAHDAGSSWALATCARCEGLLAGDDAFDRHFQRSFELLERSPLRLELARTQLAYGERLRREGRRRDARPHLRAAHDAFTAVAATPWQERSAAELRATGEAVTSASAPLPDLTPQELHISLLVAEGKTNKEIAAAMFLSAKTVEYHLSNTYRKLDIHSRAALTRIVVSDLETPSA